ncbi:hypothetical protein BDB01DRAFT_796443 [Pilobolus umbonatus]|nr:hypothetical protein BDB01DRAFT_796443 [Pilobolus umbonatus]
MDKEGTRRRPIPFAVLKIQFKRLVQQQDKDNKGVLHTKDLLLLIDQYEQTEDVVLLTEEQKKAILPYTLSNPDLEMTADDILNLLKLVCPPAPVSSLSAPTSMFLHHLRPSMDTIHSLDDVRPRTSPPLTNKSTPWKRRPSAVASSIHDRNELLQEISLSPATPLIISSPNLSDGELTSPNTKDHTKLLPVEEEYSSQDIARYYRRSLKLTQRLKSSEKSLASMARDNEDRILDLQNKVDDMNVEVAKQRKEIQEYKGKERNSLEQIMALESHISSVQQSETDQKQVYMSIRNLFDEKCEETQKLQELLKQKEADLEKTESLLNSFQTEVYLLSEERNRLMDLQNGLEQELETSAQAHKQLEEQKSENEKLKDIIDSLKTDLDEALHLSTADKAAADILASIAESHVPYKTLENELIDQDDYTQDKLRTAEDEKDYYKNCADKNKEDLDKVKSDYEYLQRALDSANRQLVNELEELKKKTHQRTLSMTPPNEEDDIDDTPPILIPTNILQSLEMELPEPMNDVWSSSLVRQRKNRRKRTVRDLHESSSMTKLVFNTREEERPTEERPTEERRLINQKDDKVITNTVTFALYTVLIYFFGIVTSTFLLDGSQPQGWEHALVAAASGQLPRSKFLEIILYWLEKLLFEPQGLPIS